MGPEPTDVVAYTERLVLRRWRRGDAADLAAINADPDVMTYVGGVLDRAGSDALLERLTGQWSTLGYGRAAAEDRATGRLLGFVGLGPHAALPGEVEIGWRLARQAWGRGLATEAASVVRDLAFDELGLERIVSVALPDNAASVAVMRKLGMRYRGRLHHDGLLLSVHEMHAGDPRPRHPKRVGSRSPDIERAGRWETS